MLKRQVYFEKKLGEQKESSGLVSFGDFVLSTNKPDEHGDRVVQDWDLTRFSKNPIVLFNHKTSEPIGQVANIRVSESETLGEILISNSRQDIISLLNDGVLRCVSVGFKGDIEYSELTKTYNLVRNALFEVSLVSLPANEDCIRKEFLGMDIELLQ